MSAATAAGPRWSIAEVADRSIVTRPPPARTVAAARAQVVGRRRLEEPVQREVQRRRCRRGRPSSMAASSAAAARSGNIVRSPVVVDEHDDAPGAPATLEAGVDAGAARSSSSVRPAASSPTRPMKRAAAAGGGDGDGHVGPAAASRPVDHGRVVGAGARRLGGPDDDVLDEVADHGDDGGRWSARGGDQRRVRVRADQRPAASDAAGRADRVDHQPDARARQVHGVVRQALLVRHRGPVGEDDLRVALGEEAQALVDVREVPDVQPVLLLALGRDDRLRRLAQRDPDDLRGAEPFRAWRRGRRPRGRTCAPSCRSWRGPSPTACCGRGP